MKNFLQGSVGGRLKFVRAGTGKKQKEIAKELSDHLSRQQKKEVEIKQQALSFYESDRRKVPLPVISAFAKLYGVRLEWLLTGTGIMQDLDNANHELGRYSNSTDTEPTSPNVARDATENNKMKFNTWFDTLEHREQIGMIFKSAVGWSPKNRRLLVEALTKLGLDDERKE